MSNRSMLLGLWLAAACTHESFPRQRGDDDALVAPAFAEVSASVTPGLVVEPNDAAASVFDEAKVQTYDLTIDPADLAKLDARPSAEVYVPATLRFGDESHRVAVRYKGSVGAFLPPCTGSRGFNTTGPKTGKCSLKIAFDEFDDAARFHGLRKLNLHAMNNDPSMLLERLSYSLFREMNVAASRATHARVVINGKMEGLFLAVEEVDGRFTRSRFPEDGKGNIYKEVWPVHDDAARYRSALESNKAEGNVEKMLAFKRAIGADPESAAATYLEREYVLRYLAVDRVIMNDDGPFHMYCGFGNMPGFNHNFAWYESEDADRMWLVPWDLDHAMASAPETLIWPAWWQPVTDCACRIPPGGLPQRPASCDPLIKVFSTWKADYDATVDRFLAGPFGKVRVDEKLERWIAQIAPHVAEAAGVQRAPTVEAWRAGIGVLRSNIERLRANRGYKYE